MVERSLARFVVVTGATAFVTQAWQVLALAVRRMMLREGAAAQAQGHELSS
jgi:hypothetical protein